MSYIYTTVEKVADITIVSCIQDSLGCIEMAFRTILRYTNYIMIDHVRAKVGSNSIVH